MSVRDSRRLHSIALPPAMVPAAPTFPSLNHLIIVCCHAVWLGGPKLGVDESEWSAILSAISFLYFLKCLLFYVYRL